jgi:hypothetical protein
LLLQSPVNPSDVRVVAGSRQSGFEEAVLHFTAAAALAAARLSGYSA